MRRNIRFYLGKVYCVRSGNYHNFAVGAEVKILEIFNDICDCEDKHGLTQLVKKQDLEKCKKIG